MLESGNMYRSKEVGMDSQRTKELYEMYGKLMLEAEIIQAKLGQVKQAIINEAQKPLVDPKGDLPKGPKNKKEKVNDIPASTQG